MSKSNNVIELKLGQVLRDKVTKFEGVAFSRSEFLTGTVQVSLTPIYNPSEAYEKGGRGFDIPQLEYVREAFPAPVILQNTGIELGVKVKDIVSGMTGIVIERIDFLNGCVYYMIELAVGAKAIERKNIFLEYKRLTVMSKGIFALIAARKKADAAQLQKELNAVKAAPVMGAQAIKPVIGRGGPVNYKAQQPR